MRTTQIRWKRIEKYTWWTSGDRVMGIKLKNKGTIIYFLLMIALSFFFVMAGIKSHTIFWSDDMPYHINRIQELVNSLKHGNWYPYIYTKQFKEVPYPLGIFYPQVTLIPIAALCILFNNYIIGIYAGFALYTFLTMIIMYVISRKLNKSMTGSFIISIVYSFSAYRLLDAYGRFAMGEFLAMTFIPMAIYGLYAVMKNGNDWEYLGIGLSFTLLSHVLSSLLCVIFLVIEFVVMLFFCKNWKQTFKSLIKAVIVFLFSSAIFIGPFIEQEVYQRFLQPSPTDLSKTSSVLSDLIRNSLNNNIIGPTQITETRAGTIGIVLLIVMVWGMINFRKLDKLNKFILILGTLSFLMATRIFPWSIMMHTPLKVIQFPFRILVFTTLLLSFTAGEMFESFYGSTSTKKIWKSLFTFFCLVIIVCPWFASYKSLQRAELGNSNNFTEKVSFAKGTWPTLWYLDQYTPAKAMKKYQQMYDIKAQVNGKIVQLTKVTGKVNEMIYSDKTLMNQSKVVLPASMYKNIQIWQNGKRLKVNKTGLVTLTHTSGGPIKYRYVPSTMDNVSRYVSVITWLGMCLWGVVKMVGNLRRGAKSGN